MKYWCHASPREKKWKSEKKYWWENEKKKKKRISYSFVEKEECQRGNNHSGVHPPTLPLFSPMFIKGNPGGFAGHFYFAQKL